MSERTEGDEMPKRRYFIGPYEDGEPKQVMTLESALDNLREWFQDGDVGDEFTYRIAEFTEAEYEKLPEI
jgi:hypothetical protein